MHFSLEINDKGLGAQSCVHTRCQRHVIGRLDMPGCTFSVILLSRSFKKLATEVASERFSWYTEGSPIGEGVYLLEVGRVEAEIRFCCFQYLIAQRSLLRTDW